MTSILSSGYGRLHLAQSAEYLGRAGVDVKLVCGWVPKNPDSWLVRLCSKIVGRNLAPGLRKRMIVLDNGGEVLSCAWADFMCNALFIVERKLFKGRFHDSVAAFAWSVFGWQTRRFIRKAAKQGKKVVLHVRSGAGGGGGVILFAKRLGVPVIVDHSIAHPGYMEQHLKTEYERNGVRFTMGMSSPFWRMVENDCREADVVLVNSEFVKDTFLEAGYDFEKIRVVYLGVRQDFFGLRKRKAAENGRFRLLFTGGFGFRKGAEYLLEALKLLKEKGDVPFVMDAVGSYEEVRGVLERYGNLVSRVERVEDSTRSTWMNKSLITFHGPVPQDDLKKYLANSDIYVFPSLAEGCASSGMEAMAAGMCVVATHESGLPIEDGRNGCIVSAKNPCELAEKIRWLMANPNEVDRMGVAASKTIRENYTWEKYAENVKKIYEELLGSCAERAESDMP